MLNDVLLRSRETPRYCTVSLAKLIPMPRGATIVSASGGHPLPMLVRADGRVEGSRQPSSELPLHQAIYRARVDLRIGLPAHKLAILAVLQPPGKRRVNELISLLQVPTKSAVV